jgi:hypothetical protein
MFLKKFDFKKLMKKIESFLFFWKPIQIISINFPDVLDVMSASTKVLTSD